MNIGRILKEMVILGLGGISLVYLLNPGLGGLESIPDVLPVVGNLDEATATIILINVAAYYGMDLRGFFSRQPAGGTVIQEPTRPGEGGQQTR